jgi:tetratricopeptide (TPR) repeat protein
VGSIIDEHDVDHDAEAFYVSRMRIHAALLLLLVAGCPSQARNEARSEANAGNQALHNKLYDDAIDKFTKAIEKDNELHPAHWGLGLAYLNGKNDAEKASAEFAKCVQLLPDNPTYNLYYGMALFKKGRRAARDEQARRVSRKPEELEDDVDLSGVNFVEAQKFLEAAIKLSPDMSTAHYFLAQIFRAQERAKDAADEFTKAIATGPREQGSYVALAELYRRWDYTDQAIQVAKQGTNNVVAENEKAEIWFVLGMGYDDKRMEKDAIEAFSKALEAQKDHHRAKFQRGQAYFRNGDMSNAKRDLEEFSKSGGASLDFIKQQASRMLQDIAAKAAGANKPKQSPEEAVKGAKDKDKKGGGFKPPKK